MRPDATAPQRRAGRTSVDPSRAWIIGLTVEADGSLSRPTDAAPEWPEAPLDPPIADPASAHHRIDADPDPVPVGAGGSRSAAAPRWPAVDPSTCACPDDCTIDHENA
jgi:hypothetical protein